MDGLSQHGQTSSDKSVYGQTSSEDKSNSIEISECEIGQIGGTQTLRTQQTNKFSKETKSMSFLTSFTANQNVQATNRNFEVIFRIIFKTGKGSSFLKV